jgi:DNA-binding response OmpR family regulator
MTYCSKYNRILLISDDKFIVGLLTGYCAANHFILDYISCSKLFEDKTIENKFVLLLIDNRMMSMDLIEASLGLLHGIHDDQHVSVCVIRTQDVTGPLIVNPWVDFYITEPVIEQLEHYLDNIFLESHAERRNGSRRKDPDRRAEVAVHSASNADILVNGDDNFYDLGPFKIDRSCHSVFFKGKDLELTGKEFKLFCLLADSFEQVCTTDKIIKHLWPQTHRATKSDLYQYMHLLRKKVEHDPDNPHWILTIKGVGYKLHVVNNSRYIN